MEFEFSSIAQIVGGVALFLYGLSLFSDNLKRYAGAQLKLLLGLLTKNRWSSMTIGAFVAFAMQSSSAATALMVELTGSGLLNLPQALAVSLGTGVGTSMTVQLIANFRLKNFALLFIAVGVLLHFVARRRGGRAMSAALMGFGMIFYGMHVMEMGFEPLGNSPEFEAALQHLAATPWLGIVGAAVLTAIIQASAATIAVAVSLATAGVLEPSGAVAIVIGANIGTCATAMIASARTGRKGLQVALGNLSLKVCGAILFSLVFGWAVVLAGYLGDEPRRQIANFHTFFNVAVALVLAPFVYYFGKIVLKLLPIRVGEEDYGLQHVDLKMIDPPGEALDRAWRDVVLTAERTAAIVKRSRDLIEAPDRNTAELLIDKDNEIDDADEILTIYLSRIGARKLSAQEAKQRTALLGILQALERIGDLVTKELVPGAVQRIEKGASFAIEGAHQLRDWHKEIARFVDYAVACVRGDDVNHENMIGSDEVELATRRLYHGHYERVSSGVQAALGTTSQFTDGVAVLRQIHFQASEVVRLAAELNGKKSQS